MPVAKKTAAKSAPRRYVRRAPARRAAPRQQRSLLGSLARTAAGAGSALVGQRLARAAYNALPSASTIRDAATGAAMAGVGRALAGISGYGAYYPSYSIKSNALSEGNMPPEVTNGSDGSFVMRHREYVQDISSVDNGAFNIDTFNINPGNKTLFPWLSPIAAQFEQYRVEGMIFEFRSNYGEATTGAMGSVVMATEYEVNRAAFTSKVQMENHQYASSCKPSLSMLHPIECARSQTPLTELSVRVSDDGTHDPNDDEDARFSDLGKFQIATQGVGTTGAILGELWLSYQIRFFKPRINTVVTPTVSFYYNDASVSTTNPFGDITQMVAGSTNDLDLTLLSGGFIQFPVGATGTYFILVGWKYSSEISTDPAITGLVNCSQVVVDNPWNGVFSNAPVSPEVATQKMKVYSVTMDGDPSSFAQVQIQSGGQTTYSEVFICVWQAQNGLGTFNAYSVSDFAPFQVPKLKFTDLIAERRWMREQKALTGSEHVDEKLEKSEKSDSDISLSKFGEIEDEARENLIRRLLENAKLRREQKDLKK